MPVIIFRRKITKLFWIKPVFSNFGTLSPFEYDAEVI